MVKTLPSHIASLRHYIALYQGNILPLPGTKRYVGRENPHSLFYSSPFTKSSETPINTGVARGEECRTTLHLSSPLFTLCKRINAEPLTYHEAKPSMMTSDGLQWWLKQGVRNDLAVSKKTGWRVVKSGEECLVTLHAHNPLIYSWLCSICEEWK